MFERFTDRARRAVMVLAQEEARLLGTEMMGTEALLLGLVHEGGGVAAVALDRLGVNDLEEVRCRVKAVLGETSGWPGGHMPYTDRAKKVFELSLREALQLGHNYTGTEHILLALIREGQGVGAHVLVKEFGLGRSRIRQQVIQLLSGYTADAAKDAETVIPQTAAGLLTQDELTALRLTAELAGLFGRIVGDADSRHGDLGEIVSAIHILQRYLLAQAGCRAYPGEYRLLGGRPPGEAKG